MTATHVLLLTYFNTHTGPLNNLISILKYQIYFHVYDLDPIQVQQWVFQQGRSLLLIIPEEGTADRDNNFLPCEQQGIYTGCGSH